ncbi:hypothetical protein WA158_007856 [Blastocystis sp. Blastoise]
MQSDNANKEDNHLFQWFRSREMEYVRVLVEESSLHKFVTSIGDIAAMQVTDLNWHQTAIERKYVGYIRRCDEMERQIRYFQSELDKFHVEVDDSIDVETFMHSLNESSESSEYYFNNLESTLEEREKDLRQFNEYNTVLTKQYNEKVELLYVLDSCLEFTENEHYDAISNQTDIENSLDASLKIDHVSGVINESDKVRFERMLFRATRGNCLVHFTPIQQTLVDPITGQDVKKYVFLVFYRSHAIEMKVNRIIEAFNAHSYPIPPLQQVYKIKETIEEVTKDLEDSENVLKRNIESCESLLENIAKYMHPWAWTVKREKAIYDVMNRFVPVAGGMYRGDGWILTEMKHQVENILNYSHNGVEGRLEMISKPWPKPPTYMKSNTFTKVTQSVVNTYGVPRYLEMNPAVWTLATFPVQFGIMFGDFGHALLLTLVAVYFLVNEKKILKNGINEMLQLVFQGRNMLIVMGLCAMFVGLIYNDTFGLSMDFFGTTYTLPVNGTSSSWNGNVYPFGIDPLWRDSTNELAFINSYKMKQSIIFGVAQMVFGLLLNFGNNIYFKEWLDLFAESIPQFLFMCCLFGYMCFIIIFKWLINWDYRMSQNMTPPQLITTMIKMALSPGVVENPLFEGQGQVQLILLLIAVVCVPWMLLGKPLWFLINKKCGKAKPELPQGNNNEDILNNPTLPKQEEEMDSFGQVFIFSAIETIEFCLGCVSHTASFLRLWALSLAHSQLAAVFWQKIMLAVLPGGNFLFIGIAYAIFMIISIFILLVMDALECYLHALRLHWVEFQDKFYHADGYNFTPLNIKKLLLKKVKEE